MAASGSHLTVYGAIAANIAIAITKFIAAGFTGSAAMLAEGIHSVVDTLDGALLLLGMRRARRGPTADHPFGHGKELFFWSLIVAVLIFGMGGGVSIFSGVYFLIHPRALGSPGWNYAVLAASALFDGASFAISLRQFLKEKSERPFWNALHASKNPAVYTVIAEDGAALGGVAAAALGVFLSHWLDDPAYDAAASIVIGCILCTVAVVLVHEARGLLVGEGVRPETAEDIRRIALSEAGVTGAARPLSMYMGPEEVLLALRVDFAPSGSAGQLDKAVAAIKHRIRAKYPRMKRIYVEARTAGRPAENPH